MKTFRYFILSAVLVAFGLSAVSTASAQRDPRDKKRGDTTVVRTDTIRKKDDGRGGLGDKKDSTFRPDTIRKKDDRGGLGDKLGKGPKRRDNVHELVGFLMNNDSCRDVLLAQMSAEDAASLTALLGSLKGGNDQLKTLRADLRAAREAGDSAAFRAISEQLKTLYRQIGDNHKAIADLLGKYKDVAMRVRIECGGRPDKDRDGGKKGENKDGEQPRSMISPNPVPVGGTAVLTVNLATESNVGVTIADQTGTVLTIAPALLAAGQQQIALDVSGLPRGAYLVQVQIGDKVQVLKLMIG
jgi:hypothetical protein